MRNTNRTIKKSSFAVLITLLLTTGLFPGAGIAEMPKPDWVVGPAVVDLGKNLAELSIDEKFIFAGAEDTKKIMEYIGNPLSNNEIGYIAPNHETAQWFIVFDYLPIGYVKDDEKDNIDADAILDVIKRGTENANKIREKNGFAPLIVKGWFNRPYYDQNTHNLTWTILAEENGVEIVNHNVRILGRHGFISLVLVADMETMKASKAELNEIVANISYKKGKSYTEYVKGDKIAKYGLTALIAGGAAATATKFGLFKFLAKTWKVILIALIGLLAALKNKIKSLFGGKQESAHATGQMESPAPSSKHTEDSGQNPTPDA